MIKLTFLGGAGGVSGVSYLVETNGKKILIDCGLFQGTREAEKKNREPFPVDAKAISAVIISHSHLDHVGRLPLLFQGGFCGKLFATPPTIDFTRLLLDDNRKILKERGKKDDEAFFDEKNIEEMSKLFVATEYHQEKKIDDQISFKFYEAGHILGSAIIELKIKSGNSNSGKKETKIVFSGDLGSHPVTILRQAEHLKAADYILMESTYGDRVHENREKAKDIIEDLIEETIAQKGVLLIPSFALERTQQLLYHLNELVENKRVPAIPVFIDSPLAINATAVYKKYIDYFNQEADSLIKSGDDIFKFSGLKMTPSVQESKAINDVPPPKIIIAGSGMSQGGRVLHHELRYLPNSRNTFLMVTFQAEGTLGRQILDGAKEIKILDQKIPIRAKVVNISSYSAHADQKGLLSWLADFKKPIKRIFIVQGEKNSARTLAQIIRDDFGVDAYVPKNGETVELK